MPLQSEAPAGGSLVRPASKWTFPRHGPLLSVFVPWYFARMTHQGWLGALGLFVALSCLACTAPIAPDGGTAHLDAGPGADAGGSLDAGSSPDAGAGPCVGADCEPPYVVSLTPSDGATGVTADATIRIEFSRPMDQATVLSALSISSLPAGAVSRSWNAAGTVLTITPSSPLLYATGTSIDTPPRTYTVTVAASAQAIDGSSMTSGASSTFSTLRRLTTTHSASQAADLTTYGYAMGGGLTLCPTSDDTARVGRHVSQAASGTYYGYALFDLSALGDPEDIEVLEEASFRATQSTPGGDDTGFYSDGRSVALHHLPSLPVIDRDVHNASFVNETTVTNLGTFATAAITESASVSEVLRAQWAAGETDTALFRLAPEGPSPGNRRARFNCDGFSLAVTYLIH